MCVPCLKVLYSLSLVLIPTSKPFSMTCKTFNVDLIWPLFHFLSSSQYPSPCPLHSQTEIIPFHKWVNVALKAFALTVRSPSEALPHVFSRLAPSCRLNLLECHFFRETFHDHTISCLITLHQDSSSHHGFIVFATHITT